MKDEKFKSLAERRVNNAIKQMRLIGNLANPSAYEYSDDQVKKIVSTLKGELDRVQSRFNSVSHDRPGESFSL